MKETFLRNVYRPTWVACIEIKVSSSSEIGSSQSFNPTWKLHIGMCGTIFSSCPNPKLFRGPGYLQTLILLPRRRHSRCRNAQSLLYQAILPGSPVISTKAYRRGSMHHNRDRCGQVGALKIIPKISLVESAGDDDLVREIAVTGI
jgi:hypothetical protein